LLSRIVGHSIIKILELIRVKSLSKHGSEEAEEEEEENVSDELGDFFGRFMFL
jgi:hypothetical protein